MTRIEYRWARALPRIRNERATTTYDSPPYLCNSSRRFCELWTDPTTRQFIRSRAEAFLRKTNRHHAWMLDPLEHVLFVNFDRTTETRRGVRNAFLRHELNHYTRK